MRLGFAAADLLPGRSFPRETYRPPLHYFSGFLMHSGDTLDWILFAAASQYAPGRKQHRRSRERTIAGSGLCARFHPINCGLRSACRVILPRRLEVTAMTDASSRNFGIWVGRWMSWTLATAFRSQTLRSA